MFEFPIYYDTDDSGGTPEPVVLVESEAPAEVKAPVADDSSVKKEPAAVVKPVPDEPNVLEAERIYRLTDGITVKGSELLAKSEYTKKTQELAQERQAWETEVSGKQAIIDFASPLVDRINRDPAAGIHTLLTDLQQKGMLPKGFRLVDAEGYEYIPENRADEIPFDVQQKLSKTEVENKKLKEEVARYTIEKDWNTGLAEQIRKPENKSLLSPEIQKVARDYWNNNPSLSVEDALMLAKVKMPSIAPSRSQVAPKPEDDVTTPPGKDEIVGDPYEAIYRKHAK